MKGDCDESIGRDLFKRWRRAETSPRKINTLLSDLLEKEEEIALYKSRLKELEAAFYYNLELISERDLEISVLEKQLRSETEQQEAIIRERDELEELVKVIDEKKNRKIQQLETKLALKEDEIRELQRDNMSNVNALKRMINDIKTQQEKKLYKLSDRYEFQVKEFIKNCQEEMEEKEKYYLLEIDTLTGKLEQTRREKEAKSHFEKEYRKLKFHLEDVERLFQEKENYYLEEISRRSKPPIRQISREVQCGFTNSGIDRNVQAEPDKTPVECQTRLSESETQYKKKISFLEEQNEVLKCVIKEMKKNRSLPKVEDNGSGCECSALEMVEQVNKKFEGEINNVKKILEEEKKQRREEEAVIQSLETSVTCLKDKLLMELQEKLQQFSGGNSSGDAYSHEIQVTLLEEKLSKKMDALMMEGRDERQKVYRKLEEVKNECIEKIGMYMTLKKETKGEDLLEKIRLEIQKLENKIESDLKNIVRNNLDKKYDKNIQPRVTLSDFEEIQFFYPDVLSNHLVDLSSMRGVYCKNDLSSDKTMTILKTGKEQKAENQIPKIKLGNEKVYRKSYRKPNEINSPCAAIISHWIANMESSCNIPHLKIKACRARHNCYFS